MCRLAYLPPGNPLQPKELARLFDFLDHAQGGNGMGLGWVNGDGRVQKGVLLEAKNLAKKCRQLTQKGFGVLFHARRASAGGVSDALCHPFVVDGPAWAGVLCHNGHDVEFAAVARWLSARKDRPFSDTAAYAYALGLYGWKDVASKVGDLDGVILALGVDKGLWARSSGWGDLHYCPKFGIWASQLPEWLGGYSVGDGVHKLDSVPKEEKSVVYKVNGAITGFQSGWANYQKKEIGLVQTR